MVTSSKPSDMNDISATPENTPFRAAGIPGGLSEPEGLSSRLVAPTLGGKDHTMSPVGTPEPRISVEDGSKTAATNTPGTSKKLISEDLTGKCRPGTATGDLLESHAGNSPTGVGFSHQWMEAKR